jgi:uncharacterized protein (DUF1330 family)
MAAYVLVDIQVTEPQGYEEYKKQAEATVTAYGGRYIVRGGKTEVMEGEWPLNRLVVLEFPSVARAKEWLHSKEYAAPRKLRQSTAVSRMIIVDGV